MTATKKQLLPTEGDIMPTNHIENLILDIRGQQVMLDRDLANLYGVDTKVLNQAVKRNIERFPVRFRFQLSDLERDKLVTNCDRLQMLKHSNVNPFVFTEQGVAMLSTVLGHKKPHPEPMFRALEILGCDASKVLSIGNQIIDLQASKAAGILRMLRDYFNTKSETIYHTLTRKIDTLL